MNPLVLLFSDKTRAVLVELLGATGPLSAAEIGRRAGLSAAQVRYCLRTIEPWLRERRLPLIKTPRVGLYVPDRPALRKGLLAEVRGLPPAQLALTGDERVSLLLLRLLLADGFVPQSALSSECEVSRSSAFRDLAEARRWLARRGLAARTRRRVGVRVEGNEAAWRQALVELLLANVDEGQLIALCAGRAAEGAPAVHESRFAAAAEACLCRLNMTGTEGDLTVLEKELGGAFPDRPRIRLALHLALSRQRMQAGRVVRADECPGQLPPGGRDAELQLAEAALASAMGSTLPLPERQFLALRVAEAMAEGLVARGGLAGPGPAASVSGVSSTKQELAKALTREAAKYLNARLFHDGELADCLALELSRAGAPGSRTASFQKGGAPGDATGGNPLFGFAQRVFGPILAARGYARTPELAGAMAIHLQTALERHGRGSARRRVWVVCGAGVATARNLITRLNLYLPQLEILGLASAFELAREPGLLAGADAVISTIPLDWLGSVPVLRVSPLLTASDVALLRTTLGLDDAVQPPVDAGPAATQVGIADLLSVRAVERVVVADHWEAVVDRAGALLLKAGAVWPSYIEAMKDMIRLYGPYVVVAPGAALLHAGPDMGGKRLCFSLVVLEQPVAFGHESNDPVGLALAFSAIDHSTHLHAVGQAINLLADAGALRAIRAAPTAEQVLEVIRARA